jgi:hypothetical protein
MSQQEEIDLLYSFLLRYMHEVKSKFKWILHASSRLMSLVGLKCGGHTVYSRI